MIWSSSCVLPSKPTVATSRSSGSTTTSEVQLQGACGSCAISAVTLQGGVERLLKERLPWVTEVTGGVDESMDPFESASMGRGGYVPRWE